MIKVGKWIAKHKILIIIIVVDSGRRHTEI